MIRWILNKSVFCGLAMLIAGLLLIIGFRFYIVLAFIPGQINKAGSFWQYLTGQGIYDSCFTDPVAMALFSASLIANIAGLILLFGGVHLSHKYPERIIEQDLKNLSS